MDCERVREPRFPVVTRMFTSFRTRLDAMGSWHELVRCDRGTHNRGVFGSTLAKNGVAIRPAGLEAPEQIGRVERRGAMLKKDDVESHQGHARFSQKIDGHDSQRMLERRQRDGSTRRICSRTVGALTSSTQFGHHG